MNINILFEDKFFIICEKPPGVLSEADGSGNDIISILYEQTGTECLLVHRLDRDTGGVMVIAKTSAAASRISTMIQNHEFSKEYLATVTGIPEEPAGTFNDLLFRDKRKNKSFVVNKPRKGVKEASLEYKILCSGRYENKPGEHSAVSLAQIRLHTGRTHQIRVQFASRKMPLIGDSRYGSSEKKCKTALWSFRINFTHPFTQKSIDVKSIPPKIFPWDIFEIPYSDI